MITMPTVGELIQLKREHQGEIYDFLATSPIENVMLMGQILEEGLSSSPYREFIGYRAAGVWQGVAYFSGDITIFATSLEAVDAFARHALKRSPLVPRIISRKDVVDRFWETFRYAPYPLLFDRHQLVYTLDPADLRAAPEPALRQARLNEADQVARLASAMSLEEIQLDPLKEHPLGYFRLVQQRIRLGRYYVLEEQGQIKFQVHLNSLTPYAGQVTGVYTPPEFRRQGYAQRGMGEFCRQALTRAPKLSLFVNDFNRAAIGLYEALGFKQVMEYRAIFLDAEL